MHRALCLVATIGVAASAPSAQAPSVYLEDLTWQEVRDAVAAGRTTAIVYTGSTEQNGPHMALGKHNFIARYVSGRIAEELGTALVYPTLPFAPTGDAIAKTGHMRFPGSVSIAPEIFFGVVRQLAESAIAAGFKNIFLMGDHGGGQNELKLAAEELEADRGEKGAHIYYVPDLYFKEKEQMREYLAARHIPFDSHAGTDDTSEVMYIDAGQKWIRREKLSASDSTQQAITGVDGDPTKASPEMGRVFVEYKVSNAVAQIRALLAQHP